LACGEVSPPPPRHQSHQTEKQSWQREGKRRGRFAGSCAHAGVAWREVGCAQECLEGPCAPALSLSLLQLFRFPLAITYAALTLCDVTDDTQWAAFRTASVLSELVGAQTKHIWLCSRVAQRTDRTKHCIRSHPRAQNHTITESLELEGTSEGHLVQLPPNEQGHHSSIRMPGPAPALPLKSPGMGRQPHLHATFSRASPPSLCVRLSRGYP